MANWWTRVAARLVHSTTWIDTAYQKFDRLRSLSVLALGSPAFFETHTKIAYDATPAYRADSPRFRSGLFAWEEEAVRKFFPAPPARVLLGGAGGGREAYPLIEMGYEVVAFDPAPELAATMAERARRDYPTLRAYRAGYEDLPLVHSVSNDSAVDLASLPPFDATILGWCSLTHLVLDSERKSALQRVAALTQGPILVSGFPAGMGTQAAISGRRRLVNVLRKRALRYGKAIFTTGIGFARLLTEDEFRALVDSAGLEIVHSEWQREWPHAILRPRSV